MRRTTRTRTAALLGSALVLSVALGVGPAGTAAAAASATAQKSVAESTATPDATTTPEATATPAPTGGATDSNGAGQVTEPTPTPSPTASSAAPAAGPAGRATAAAADDQRFTDHGDVRVYDSGWLAMTPRFKVGADGKPTSAQLGLVDKTDPDAAADSWRPAADAVVHIPEAAVDGAFSLPAADADLLNGEQSVYGTDQPAAEYTQQGGMLFGFDTRSLDGQLNAGLAVSYSSAWKLDAATGDGWQVSKSDVDWNADPPARTIETVWTPEDHTANYSSTPGLYGRSAGWSFTTPGTYCFTIAEGLKTKEPKGTPATDLSTKATYTVVVGDLPESVTTCAQPGDGSDDSGGDGDGGGTAPSSRLITAGHHDLRTYIGSDGEIHWGLDSSLWSLDDVVIGRTPPAATVQRPSGSTDMRSIGPVGTQYWYFPQTSTTSTGDYVWPGWSTESMDRSLMGSKVGISLDGFTRNGAVDPAAKVMLLADTSGRPSTTYFDSSAGITSFEQGGNNHSHNIWVFTKPGAYCVAMTATMETATGHWTSATQNLAFAVGDDVDPATVQPCDAATVPSLDSSLPTPPAKSVPTRLERGGASIDLAVEGDTLRSVARTGTVQTDPELIRDPEDLIVHGARLDGATERWRGVPGNGGAVAIRTDGLDPSSVQDRHVTIGLGSVDGPGSVAAISSDASKEYGAVSTEIGGARSMDVPVRSTTRDLQWYFSKPGIYCVPLTYAAELTDGRSVSHTDVLTFAVGPERDGSGIDLSKYTTCSRGQQGVDLGGDADGDGDDQGGSDEGPRHEDVYVKNGSTNDAGATVLNDGHVDVASRMQGNTLDTVVKDTTERVTPTWRDPRKTVLQLLPESKTTVPAGFGFLGKAGSSVWQVEQTQQPNLLWPGWSTESLPEDATKGGVTWALNDVQGYPAADGEAGRVGDFTLYEQVGFGQPEVLLSSAGKRSFVINKNVHAHGTWAFSREGVYCMAMTRSAIAADGSDLQDDFVLAMAVGYVSVQDVDPTKCFSGKTPQGDAEGTTGGATPSTDDGQGSAGGAAARAQPSLSVPGTVCAAAPAASAPAAATPAAANTTVISRGHVDVGSRIVNGKLRTLVKDGSQGGVVWREPGATTIWLKPSSKLSSPGGAFSFLGSTGSPAWQIPQTQNPDLVWLGWNTEEITSAQASGPVQWRLDSVDGPGVVTIYELASFGKPETILSAGGTYAIPLGVHAHGNWGFTAEGTYRLHMTQTVPLAGGGTSSDRQTLTVVVGGSAPQVRSSSGATAAATRTTDGCETAAFGSTVPAIMQADDPETATQGGGTTAGGVRPVRKAAAEERTPAEQAGTWVLAVIGFGGVLGAGGAGSLATWLLTRRRGLGA